MKPRNTSLLQGAHLRPSTGSPDLDRRIAARVTLVDPASVPRIVLAVGPCRSGSTPLVVAFAEAGVESHMQPLKIILRCLSVGSESAWTVPTSPPDTILLKETLGPYMREEVEFNPLRVLIEAGVPTASIDVLVVGREPLATWSSWSQWWGPSTRLELFEKSMHATETLYAQAREMGLATRTFVYEALRDADTLRVGRRLFDSLGFPFDTKAVDDWRGGDILGEPGRNQPRSSIHWPRMPERFTVPHIHDRVRASEGLTYFDRSAEVAALPSDEVLRIQDSGVVEIYETWRRRCARDLERPDGVATREPD